MHTVSLRVYEELNDFLAKSLRGRMFEVSFGGKRSVKDLSTECGKAYWRGAHWPRLERMVHAGLAQDPGTEREHT